MFGAETFTELARGVPAMSRSMLIKRLGELERAGILDKRSKPDGRGHLYHLTQAGTDLAGVISSLGEWGEQWVEVTTEHADPGFALWSWCQVQLNHQALPSERTIVAFTFPQEPPTNRYYWLLIERGDVELCYSDPGGEPDVNVVAESLAFVDWHRGSLRWSDAVKRGRITPNGPADITRSIPSWNLHTPTLVHR